MALTILLSCNSPAGTGPDSLLSGGPLSRSAFRQRADDILKDSSFSNAFTGMVVASVEDSVILFDYNGNKLFHPASNVKLLTTAAAINFLHPKYEFITSYTSEHPIIDSILDGNLYVRGSGDPLITTEDLDTLCLTLHRQGVRRIRGDLVGDVSFFDTVAWGQGWMWDDDASSDQPSITPLCVNRNAIEFIVTPGYHTGSPPRVEIHPATNLVTLLSTATTSRDTVRNSLVATRYPQTNILSLKGAIHPLAKPKKLELSLWQPEFYFLNLLRERLTLAGIACDGSCRIGPAAGDVRLGEIVHSLDSVVYRVNKESDNLGAENLLKTIAALHYGTPGTSGGGLALVKEYLSRCGADTLGIFLVDGSGISWYNALPPEIFIKVLIHEHRNKAYSGLFFGSLPVAGVDGTLKNRMKGTSSAGRVRAKTGTLTGASTIAGYTIDADGTLIAFSIMIEHSPLPGRLLREAQDSLLMLIRETSFSLP